jgi:hypothetical protein
MFLCDASASPRSKDRTCSSRTLKHVFFGNYKSVANLNLAVADVLTCSNLMPPGLYRGDPNNISASLQLQH